MYNVFGKAALLGLEEGDPKARLAWGVYEKLIDAAQLLGGKLHMLCGNVYLDGQGKGECGGG
jgi:hypothetical protein